MDASYEDDIFAATPFKQALARVSLGAPTPLLGSSSGAECDVLMHEGGGDAQAAEISPGILRPVDLSRFDGFIARARKEQRAARRADVREQRKGVAPEQPAAARQPWVRAPAQP